MRVKQLRSRSSESMTGSNRSKRSHHGNWTLSNSRIAAKIKDTCSKIVAIRSSLFLLMCKRFPFQKSLKNRAHVFSIPLWQSQESCFRKSKSQNTHLETFNRKLFWKLLKKILNAKVHSHGPNRIVSTTMTLSRTRRLLYKKRCKTRQRQCPKHQ